MIRVRCLGHIGTSLGTGEVRIDKADLEAGEIVDMLRSMVKTGETGFNRFNTLAMIEDGEAFVPAGSGRRVKEGETLVLIPFSHGG